MNRETTETQPSERRHPIWGVHPAIANGALWICVSSSVILALLYLVAGDCTWWTTWIVTWPAYLWCGPLLFVSLITVSPRHRRRSLIAVGSVLLLTLSTVEWRSLVRREPQDLRARFEALHSAPAAETAGDTALRLVSWNIASYRSEPGMVQRELLALSPDLCFLQESGPVDPEQVAEEWRSFNRIHKGEFTIISRHPLERIEAPAKVLGSGPQFALLHLPGGRRVLIVNVHLIIPGPQWRIFFAEPTSGYAAHHRARMQQLRELRAAIDHLVIEHDAETVILAGDFNVHGSPRSLRILDHSLRDVWRSRGLGWGGSFPNEMPMARLDQCWVTNDITPVSAQMVGNISSDHRMLVVDLIVGERSSHE